MWPSSLDSSFQPQDRYSIFFDSLLHPVSDEILILCELFLLSATEAETTNTFSLQLVKFSSLFGDRTLQTMMLFLAHLRNI